MTDTSPAHKAIRLLGGPSEAARRLQVLQPRVSMWLNRKQVSAEFCQRIEAELAGKVTAYQLRPDIFRPAKRNGTAR